MGGALAHETTTDFLGSSAMACRMRAFDWTKSQLGSPAGWPPSLRLALSLCLASPLPMFVLWGRKLTLLYNDACLPFLASIEHLPLLGQSGHEVWAAVWETVGPAVDRTFRSRISSVAKNVLVYPRGRAPAPAYVTFTFSPIFDESEEVAGVVALCAETTEELMGNRRLRTLRELSERISRRKSMEETCRAACDALGENVSDLTYTALYLVNRAATDARLIASSGLEDKHVGLPVDVGLKGIEEIPSSSPWPLSSVFHSQQPAVGASGHSVVLPIRPATSARPVALLVAGMAANRAFDASYRAFCDLVANQIAQALASVRSAEERRWPQDGPRAPDLAQGGEVVEEGQAAGRGDEPGNKSNWREKVERLRLANLELSERARELEIANAGARDSRRAALNLLEETEESRQALQSEIRERQRADATVRRQARIINSSFEPIVVWSDEGRIVEWNKGAEHLYGYTAAEVLEQDIHRLLRTVQPITMPELMKDLHQHRTWTGQLRHVTKFGRTLNIESRRQLIELDGRSMVLETNHDITERLVAEERLRESEERLRLLIESAKDYAIFTIDIERRVNTWNAGAEGLFGYSEKEILGRSADILFTPEDQAQGDPEREVRKARAEGRAGNERWHQRKDGSRLYGSGSVMPLRDPTGALHGFVKIMRDLTEQRRVDDELARNRETLRLAQEIAEVGTFEWSIGAASLTWSPGLERIYGLREGSFEGTYARWISRVQSMDRPRLEEQVRAAMQGGDFSAEWRVIRPDGTTRWLEARAYVFKNQQGEPERMVGVQFDVTRRKHSEQALEVAQKQLAEYAEQLERTVEERTAKLRETVSELETFSYSISHDLRSPLRTMQSFAQALREDCGDDLKPLGADYIRRIIAAAERMDRVIQDVLVYSRIARSDLPLESIDIGEFVTNLVDTYPQFNPSIAEIQVVGPLPPVKANKAGLTQVLSNLLGNAIKFVSPGNRPVVRISAQAVGESVRVRVQDNGIGIEKDLQQSIFGLFQRLEPGYEGTGIGLAIVRKAVERMGGQVGVESEPGQGSTFYFDLPKGSAMVVE